MLQRLLVGIDTGGEDGEDRIGMNNNVPESGHFPGALLVSIETVPVIFFKSLDYF